VIKTEGEIQNRCYDLGRRLSVALVVLIGPGQPVDALPG
jgi:hypothetical protein